MFSLVLLILAYLICEAVVAVMFSALARLVYKRIGLDPISIFKGMLERLFLLICLSNGYPHGLTLFGALKLGTRLKQDTQADETRPFNDYYLIGNLLSVSIAIGYAAVLSGLNFDTSLSFFR